MKSPTAKKARKQLLKLLDDDSLKYMNVAHEEVRAARVYRIKGVPTLKRLAALAGKMGLLKRHGG